MALFDLDRFRQDGLIVVKDFFEPEMKARLTALGQEISKKVQEGGITRSAQLISGMDVGVAAQVSDSVALREAATAVLGPDLSHLVDRVLIKDKSFGGEIEAHQDWPYFGGDTRKLNVFVPLSRCRPENGMIIFYRGSHILGPVERGAIDVDRYPQFEPLCPDIDVGDVLFADFLTWHSSGIALQNDDRILLQVVLQPTSDRSSDQPFAREWRDLGPIVSERFTPMKSVMPTVGITTLNRMIEANRLDEAAALARGLCQESPDNIEAHIARYDLGLRLGKRDARAALWDAKLAMRRLDARLNGLLKPVEPEPDASPSPEPPAQSQATSWPRRFFKRRASVD